MRTRDIVWLALLFLAAVLTIILKYVATIPGDLAVTRLVQSLLPEPGRWAEPVSSTAKMPWLLFLIAGAFLYFLDDWRPACSPALPGKLCGFVAAWKMAWTLCRPAAPIRRSCAGYRLALRVCVPIDLCVQLRFDSRVPGCSRSSKGTRQNQVGHGARLHGPSRCRMAGQGSLGAHWPSDVAVSYLIGFLWVTLLVRFA